MLLQDLDRLTGSAGLDLLEHASILHRPEPLVLLIEAGAIRPDDERIVAASATLRRLPTVTVLVGEPDSVPEVLLAGVDLCLTDRPEPPRPWVRGDPSAIDTALADHPAASLALANLLRRTDADDVHAAIDAEAATYAMLLGGEDHRRWLRERGDAAPRTSAEPPVLVRRDASELHVELNRPGSRNAVDTTLRDALTEALALPLHDPGIERILLTGRGPDFSAGGDLREFGSVGDPATAFAVRLSRHPGRSAHLVADRLTARLHGHCVGAGIEIPAFAGMVIAAPDTRVGLPELSLGLVPGAGGTVSVRRRIGRHRTAWLALTGEVIDATVARSWGLVDEIATP